MLAFVGSGPNMYKIQTSNNRGGGMVPSMHHTYTDGPDPTHPHPLKQT